MSTENAHTLVEGSIGTGLLENNSQVSLRVSIVRPSPETPNLGVYLPEIFLSMHHVLCTRMFIVELFVIVANWKLQKCPSAAHR